MLVAVIAAVATLVVAILAIWGIVAFRSRRASGSKNRVRAKKGVHQVDSVGMAATFNEGKAEHEQTVARSSRSSSGKVGDRVRSRFIAIGVLAAGVFGTLAVRLFGMQALSSVQYENEARENKYSTVATPAPRGFIYDANGTPLVVNRTTLTVLADAQVADDHDVLQRLSSVLGIPLGVVRMRIKDASSGAQSQRVVADDASLRDVAFIAEHSDAFAGVTVQERTVREYPFGALAAHVLGYTSSISQEELDNMPPNREVELGDMIGKSGIEAFYDNVLAGEHGQRVVIADSQGRVVEVESETEALKGSDVHLTIQAPVQYVADMALANSVAPTGVIGEGRGVGGAVVAIDVSDGSIIAMSSYPTFDPTAFTGGVANDIWEVYRTEESHYPLLNRAIAGTYPAASTYKAFTSLAGLRYGFADFEKEWYCAGSWDGFNSGDIQNCWDLSGHGEIDLYQGIVQSCDVVFYEIAKDFFYAGESQGGNISDTAMQEEISKFGFGSQSGIDLDGEEPGRIPTPEWKAAHWSDVPAAGKWYGGDLTNLVIGQGDCLVTPLQMAVAYGAVATGKLLKPHLLKEVRNTAGDPVITYETTVVSEPDVKKKHIEGVREALGGVAAASTTLVNAFAEAGLNVENIGSKTGTGEVAGKGDVAWYVCYYPLDNPRYLVATCIEEGGGGAQAAGPIGAEVLGAVVAAANGELTDFGRVAGSSGRSVEYNGGGGARAD